MIYRTPLGRARGLGSAGRGSADWWRQRLSALALVPLAFWLAPAIARLPAADYGSFVHWVRQPWNSLLLLSFILAAAYHAVLGLQVIVEDYVHSEGVKLASLIGLKLAYSFFALVALYAAMRIILA